MVTSHSDRGPATRGYKSTKMTNNERLIFFIFVSGLGFLSLLWLQLRYVYYRDIDNRKSMYAQMIMHGFQGAMLIVLGLFTGQNRIIKQIDLSDILPVLAIVYFITNMIAYIFKVKEYNAIIDARHEVNQYHRQRKETTDNDISKIT